MMQDLAGNNNQNIYNSSNGDIVNFLPDYAEQL